MKNRIFLVAISSLLALGSCQSIFDQPDDGTVSYDDIYTADNLVSAVLNTSYNKMPTLAASYSNSTFLAVFTDEAFDSKATEIGGTNNYYAGQVTSLNNIIDNSIYDDCWAGIRLASNFIANIDDAENLTVESYRTKWKGEAYTLRAFYYLQLIKRFGPMPIFTAEVPDNYDYSKISRPTFYENVKAIIADCDLALSQPDFKARCEKSDQNGSVTAATAWAIKSQAILYAASPLWNGGEDHWAEAAEITAAANEYMIENGFELYNPATSNVKAYSNYQRYFLIAPEMTLTPSQDKETIYAQKSRLAVWASQGLPITTDQTKAGSCPSQELVDAYETIDGVPVLDPVEPYIGGDRQKPNYNAANTMYDPENPYENRDPRLLSTVYCNGSQVTPGEGDAVVETFEGGNCGISAANFLYTPTGYYLRKFQNYESKSNSASDGYWRYFRYAEILLNYAEAEFYANGVTQKALDAINAVRNRAGMPNIEAGISEDEFEARLRNERRVEFAFEEHRYYDLRRWKIQADWEGQVSGMKITRNETSGELTYNRFVASERPVTDEKYLIWPISLTEQNKFKMVGVDFQNYGW